jgi:hypothetical protein
VSKVDVEYHEDRKGRDLVRVTYDPGKLTPGQILEVIREKRFEATIVPNEAGRKKP